MVSETRSVAYHALSGLSGLAWGLLVWQVIFEGLLPAVFGGVIASPFIGLGIGMATKSWYRRPVWLQIGVALLSLYAAAVIFAVAVGVYEVLFLDLPNRIPSAVVLQTVLGYLWGLTLTGYLLVLGPLAYLNHWLVGLVSPDRLETGG